MRKYNKCFIFFDCEPIRLKKIIKHFFCSNMPYKVLAAMEWASQHLKNNILYASADDDFIVDLDVFVRNTSIIVSDFKENWDNFPIICLFVRGIKEEPMRYKGKWTVTRKEYKKKFYPTYCHGGMYVMSMPITKSLWNVSRTSPMLRFDDVWITGILRTRLQFSDTLVYFMPKVARHFKTVNFENKLKMKDLWKNFTSPINHSSLCTCTL